MVSHSRPTHRIFPHKRGPSLYLPLLSPTQTTAQPTKQHTGHKEQNYQQKHIPVLRTPTHPHHPTMAEPRIFCGNLSWQTDDNSLRDAFSQFGPITDAVVMKDRETGEFCFNIDGFDQQWTRMLLLFSEPFFPPTAF